MIYKGLGISGAIVTTLQLKLLKLGFNPKTARKHPDTGELLPTGVFDLETAAFVENLCKKYKVPYQGRVTTEIEALVDSLLITPPYKAGATILEKEDFDDPEEAILNIGGIEESKTCPNLLALATYIDNFKLTRKVNTLFFHCTATPQTASISAIQNHWKSLGWKSPGYHIIVKPNGEWTVLLDFNGISNGVQGYNSTSINISYIGGVDSKNKPVNNMTQEQLKVFKVITEKLKIKIKDLKVRGHNEVSKKACPSFIVKEWLAAQGL